jgi:HD-GYP domain-containing protein (c-di-GMP phosphodiesterase class II)
MLVEEGMALLRADHASLALMDNDRKTLVRKLMRGILAGESGSASPVVGSLPGWVARTGTIYAVEDFQREPLPPGMDVSAYRGFGPLAIVPLRSEDEIIGTFLLARQRKPDSLPFTHAEVRLLEGIAEMGGTAIRRARLHQDLQQAYIQMVLALAQAIESRDAYTAGHSERLVALAEAVARDVGREEKEIEDIRWAARLHDIGKIGVPDSILRKPAALTEPEWMVMHQHPAIGEKILRMVERMRGVAELVRHHQERWDGTGYPDRLRGNEIPIGARILAVVDAYGAITETRPYRAARTHEEAVAEIQRCAGTQFDPQAVEAFCRVIERTPRG